VYVYVYAWRVCKCALYAWYACVCVCASAWCVYLRIGIKQRRGQQGIVLIQVSSSGTNACRMCSVTLHLGTRE
jgi:multisubunit Na+/H+ antiporter MnhE subunit